MSKPFGLNDWLGSMMRLIFSCAVAAASWCAICQETALAESLVGPRPLGGADYLCTRGTEIVNRAGQPVRLRGVNIGGWLVTEGWMCGQTDKYKSGRGAREQLEERFGPEKAAVLVKAWEDNWFTTQDLDQIQSWGFNVIRVPFSYRTLQDAAGNWTRNAAGEIDFSRMDWVVREAGRRGIHVIFDLHMWPRQIEKDQYGLPSRWSEEGKAVRAKMRTLWAAVAKHFKGNGVIAGFDVINEPEGSPWNAPHHAFTDAIREQDPERMVIVEWCGYEKMVKEFPKNAVYSDHYTFKDEASLEKYRASLKAHPEVKVPLFLGEMKAGQDNAKAARWMAEAMDKEGWHWAVWTYKGVNVGGWAAFNYHGAMRYDLFKDSYESLLDKWTNGLNQWRYPAKPKNYYLTNWWIEGFRQSR